MVLFLLRLVDIVLFVIVRLLMVGVVLKIGVVVFGVLKLLIVRECSIKYLLFGGVLL